MGCGSSKTPLEMTKSEKSMKAALLIQRWYRRYQARLEARRRVTWNIFQSIEYAGEQDQLKLYNFFNDMIDHVAESEPGKLKFQRALNHHHYDIFMDTASGNPWQMAAQWSANQQEEDAELEKLTDFSNINIESTYSGPHVTFPVTLSVVKHMIDAFKNGQILHAKYTLRLLHEVRNKLKLLPNISQATTNIAKQITICGDLHGKIDDLFMIFYKNGHPSAENPYIFNGDFVDRGSNSVEIALLLFSFFLVYPNEVYLNRGNHEDHIMNLRYGFIKEVMSKYRKHATKVVRLFEDVFSWLPLATIIDGKILVAHGGISDRTDLTYLGNIDRHKYLSALRPPVDSTLDMEDLDGNNSKGDKKDKVDVMEWRQILDILWSDPKNQEGCRPNTFRGGGSYFGPDITKKVLAKHNLELLIRSHECRPEGYEYTHNGQVLTVFSASNYYELGSNKGAYVKLDSSLTPRFVQYSATRTTRKLTAKQSLSIVEESALRDLRYKVIANKTTLMAEFKKCDTNNTGLIPVGDWAQCMASVLELSIPWRTFKDKLVQVNEDGMVKYETCVDLDVVHNINSGPSITETLYRHKSNLETIFRVIDKDNSGQISMEEFEEACKILGQHINSQISEEQIRDTARSIDINKDGYIDFNEFLEAFRLVDPHSGKTMDTNPLNANGKAKSKENVNMV
ncbi:serine/threonine-protein phosphatase with EF-hands pef-1-like isoform X2 [Ptychodera flava]|uniref:serine/threonine-protein phosphatase with EF-hands pef-1-like isoform X2 n=1 Tax=Ptychodera flava TaxID=63121 RepID=UPI003969E79B